MAAITDTNMAEFQTALVAVSTALQAGDYAEAYLSLAHAEIALAGMPLSNVREGVTANMRASLKATREAVAASEKRSSGGRFEFHTRWVP